MGSGTSGPISISSRSEPTDQLTAQRAENFTLIHRWPLHDKARVSDERASRSASLRHYAGRPKPTSGWRLFTSHPGGGAVPRRREAASRMSASGAHGGAGNRPDVGEHAAGVPGWEGSYQRWDAVELDAALARSLGPG